MAKKKTLIRNWFAEISLANGDELNLNLPKFARPLYFFFVLRLFGTSIND